MAKRIYAIRKYKRKSKLKPRKELRKIQSSIPSVKPDILDRILIREAVKMNDGASVRYYPGMFDDDVDL